MSIPPFPVGAPLRLPAAGSWPKTVHVFDEESAAAVEAALAAQRPLLVRGEPGTGKSQLARAAATHLKRLFVSEVVHARSESQELQWQFDAVARLGEAQSLGAVVRDEEAIARRLDPRRFLAPGALWWAFDWASAQHQYDTCLHNQRRPEAPPEWSPEKGSVLLIDEIDKADADLPNGLLETLGNGSFSVPYLDRPVRLPEGIPTPLVVITTNEERELPAAFLRRCFVLHLFLPDDDPAHRRLSEEERSRRLGDWLVERGQCHFHAKCSEAVMRGAAGQLCEDRAAARRGGLNAPGQAEYLDMLRALAALAPGDDEKQQALLTRIGRFAMKKSIGLLGG